MSFVEGEPVGPYRLLEQLGQGGMATVFKAYHPALDRNVAIKALHPAFTLEPNFLARFQREAQVIARLEHPNIVPVYDYAEHEGRPYLVLKFIEGETLKKRLERGPLSREETLQVAESVGAALAYAHRKGVLHRDVKPSNILIAEDGTIYLTDFGLARMAEAGESTISSDVMLGTPQYISPEQGMGRKELDSRTDIYSFGVVLYELAVGKVPFSADTPYAIVHDHIYTPVPRPRSENPNIPEAVERVLIKALSKEREDRYDGVDRMVADWKSALESQPAGGAFNPQSVAAQVPHRQKTAQSGVRPAPERPRKGAWRSWLIAAGIIALVCLCGVLLLSLREQRNANPAAALPSATAMVNPGVGSSPTAFQDALPVKFPILRTLQPTLEARLTPRVTPDLDAAIRRLTAEPNNPIVHFNAAVAYWEAGMPDQANEEFDLSIRLAGDNPVFYIRAGDNLAGRGQWLWAAMAYAQAVKTSPRPHESLKESLESTLYLAAQEAAMLSIAEERGLLALVEPEFAAIVRARFQLYRGEAGAAREMLSRVPDSAGVDHPARLLEAEILAVEGKVEDSFAILDQLVGDPSTPEWVSAIAEYLLKALPK